MKKIIQLFLTVICFALQIGGIATRQNNAVTPVSIREPGNFNWNFET
jgi:hypothetical protein